MSSEPVLEEGDEDVVPDSGTGVYYVRPMFHVITSC